MRFMLHFCGKTKFTNLLGIWYDCSFPRVGGVGGDNGKSRVLIGGAYSYNYSGSGPLIFLK